MDFKNKTVVVTGGSRGIGRGISLAFAKANANVVIIYKENETTMNETLSLIKDLGGSAKAYKCNVADYSDVKSTFENILSKYSHVDILINNAGIAHFGLFTDTNIDEYHNIINTNLNSVFYCSKEVTPSMITKKSGIIINISSIWGIEGASCEVAYSASKGGVNTFTKALAKELGPSNIRVNAIACGYINTEMNDRLTEEEKSDFLEDCALCREGNPCDIGDLCLYLASQRSNYLTGQIIKLDGGR